MGKMNKLQSTCIIVAIAIVLIISAVTYGNIMLDASHATPNAAATVVDQQLPNSGALSARPETFHEQESLLLSDQKLDTNGQERKLDFVSPDHEHKSLLLSDHKPEIDGQERRLGVDSRNTKQAKLEDSPETSHDPTSPKQDFSYLAYYAYAEVPPDRNPADTVTGKDVPTVGSTPLSAKCSVTRRHYDHAPTLSAAVHGWWRDQSARRARDVSGQYRIPHPRHQSAVNHRQFRILRLHSFDQ